MPKVELIGVTKRFEKVIAAQDVNLSVEDREYVTILGPSGCGKTTLVKIIAGIWKPTSGEVRIDGESIKGTTTEERDMGYVFQNIALFPHMNIWDNVTYAPRVKDWDQVKKREIGDQVLELVNLLDKKGFFPRELSGGEQQKTALARALASGARLLLLDEPLSGLDARVRLDLRYELRRLVKTLGLTAIHVTHDQEEAMSISDRVVVMRAGMIVEINTPMELYNHPKTLFTANFVGESNFIEGTITKTSGEYARVEIRNQQVLNIKNNRFSEGDAVVVVVRPENLSLCTDFEEKGGISGLKGVIEHVTFMGPYLRYEITLASKDTIMVDIPTYDKKFNRGEEIVVIFNPEKMLTYPRPHEGLMEVLRLE